MQFKKKKEQTELYPITATYPLELVHLDFLSIGGKDDKMKNVLVVFVLEVIDPRQMDNARDLIKLS